MDDDVLGTQADSLCCKTTAHVVTCARVVNLLLRAVQLGLVVWETLSSYPID
jgi:hypothetical protein